MLIGETLQKTVLQCRRLKSLQELKSAISTARGKLNCHKRSLTKVGLSANRARRRPDNVIQCNGGHIEHVC